VTTHNRAFLKLALLDRDNPIPDHARRRCMAALGLQPYQQVALTAGEMREVARSSHAADRLYTAIFNGDYQGAVPARLRTAPRGFRHHLHETLRRFGSTANGRPRLRLVVSPRRGPRARRMACRAPPLEEGDDPDPPSRRSDQPPFQHPAACAGSLLARAA